MTVQDNKQLVHDFYAALVREDYDAAAAMCHEKFVFYNQIDTPPRPGGGRFRCGREEALGRLQRIQHGGGGDHRRGRQGGRYVIFEGDQCKEFYGVEPRGAHLRMSMLNLFTIEDGLISEKRAHYDRYDHIEQLQSGVA